MSAAIDTTDYGKLKSQPQLLGNKSGYQWPLQGNQLNTQQGKIRRRVQQNEDVVVWHMWQIRVCITVKQRLEQNPKLAQSSD